MLNIQNLHARSAFLAARTNAGGSFSIPTQVLDDEHNRRFFQLNLLRTTKAQIHPETLFVIPFNVPAENGPLSFNEFAADNSYLLCRVESVAPMSLTVRFLVATHQPDQAAVVAVLGVDNSSVTIPKPTHVLVPIGDLLAACQPAIAAAIGAVAPPHHAQAAGGGAPVGAVFGAPAPPHHAQAAGGGPPIGAVFGAPAPPHHAQAAGGGPPVGAVFGAPAPPHHAQAAGGGPPVGAFLPPHHAQAAGGGPPVGAVFGAPAPPHHAQAAGGGPPFGAAGPPYPANVVNGVADALAIQAALSVRPQDSLDFNQVERIAGVFSNKQLYHDMYFIKGPDGVAIATAKYFSWVIAKDRFVTLTTENNRLITQDVLVQLTEAKLKCLLTWDFRDGRCSILLFGSARQPINRTTDLLTALEALARITLRGMGPDMGAAILHLRATFAEHLLSNVPLLPLQLGAVLLDERLDRLRTSIDSDPSVAHARPLDERLRTIVQFDASSPTAIAATIHPAYLSALLANTHIGPDSGNQTSNNGWTRGNNGGRGSHGGSGGTSGHGAASGSTSGHGASPTRGRGRGRGRGGRTQTNSGSRSAEFWDKAPEAVRSLPTDEQFCFDWYLNKGQCSSGYGPLRQPNTKCHATPQRKHSLPPGEINHAALHQWLNGLHN